MSTETEIKGTGPNTGQTAQCAAGQRQLFLFQVGPVQEFIAQARSTRDLWSGSYLISWMMAHAIRAISRVSGTEIIFPDTARQPLLEFLESGRKVPDEQAVLTPNLPNRLLAEVPSNFNPDDVAAYFKQQWQAIASGTRNYLDKEATVFDPTQQQCWEFQTKNFWQITWQLWPILAGQDLRDVYLELPNGLGADFASSSDGWKENYGIVSYRLDARRQTRDFFAWQKVPGTNKDHFSGKEEAIADKKWIEKVATSNDSRSLRFDFRNPDELGAPNLIKRVWDKALLKTRGLARVRVAFDSVPAVAAAPWRAKLLAALRSEDSAGTGIHDLFPKFASAVDSVREILPFHYRSYSDAREVTEWIEANDASIYFNSEWDRWKLDSKKRASPETTRVADALDGLYGALGKPEKYIAVMALDGDSMGKWLGGEMTKGRIDRAFHRNFSQSLSRFGLEKVRPIVVDAHFGELVYSGGDDVLALLPATEALACARDLASEFSLIQFGGQPLACSAGIAIGHMHAPLQNLVEAARELERTAKKKETARGYGRSAFALGLFKRSGEQITWGSKWTDQAVELGEEFRKLSQPTTTPTGQTEKAILSSRFPYALATLLEPARRGFSGRDTWKYTEGVKDWFHAEFDHVCRQQSNEGRLRDESARKSLDEFKKRVAEYWNKCSGRRMEDLVGPFLTTAFIHRESE